MSPSAIFQRDVELVEIDLKITETEAINSLENFGRLQGETRKSQTEISSSTVHSPIGQSLLEHSICVLLWPIRKPKLSVSLKFLSRIFRREKCLFASCPDCYTILVLEVIRRIIIRNTRANDVSEEK